MMYFSYYYLSINN